MADGMHVNPEALRARAPKFAAAADKLTKAFDDLEAVKDAEGACWGSDEAGTKFEEKYKPIADGTVTGKNFLENHLNRTTEDLGKTADRWESDDQNSAANFDAVWSKK